MVFCSTKYLPHLLQRKFIGFVLLMIFSAAGYAQNIPLPGDSLLSRPVSSVVASISKKPVPLMRLHINPPYKPYFARKGGELMHWPNYPLTAGQIIARQADWQRRNNLSVGEQIASDIIQDHLNSILYGRKTKQAVVPRF